MARGDDRGSVTAEFAIVLPAFLAVLLIAIGAILLAAHRVTLTAAAAEIARLESRGDTAAAEARAAQLGPAAVITRTRRGALQCVSIRAQPASGVLASVAVSAEGCAAASAKAAS